MPTVDETFKHLPPGWRIQVHDHTRDACDRENDVIIKSATDGDIRLVAGDTKFFKIRDHDNYERSGGFYWTCGDSDERARISRADFIQAIRKDNGVIDWFWVSIVPDF
jgi:hypothetical protein